MVQHKGLACFFKARKNSFPALGTLWLLLVLLPHGVHAQRSPQPAAQALPLQKLAPALRQATSAPRAYRVQVKDAKAFEQWMLQQLPAASVTKTAGNSTILTIHNLSPDQLPALLNAPGLIFVDVPNRQPKAERALHEADLTVNHVTALQRLSPGLTGAGLTVSIKEQPFDTTDIDFKGRILKNAAFDQAPAVHATTIATLIGGAGNSAPQGRGVAPQVRLTSSDFSELLPDNHAQLQALGVSVQNHSYGVDAIENYYGLEALAYDEQTYRYPWLLHVFSSGNAGLRTGTTGPYAGLSSWANLTGQFKMSKNTLSVGATNRQGELDALSSRGPAYDGRVKPELVAYGASGTSEAAALVSGIALLAQQAYQQQHNGALPPAALIKAALINSADDLGRPEVDFETGYGQSDALGTIQTIAQKHFFTGTLTRDQRLSFPLVVPANTRALKLTLVWHDPEAGANAGKALVNDLDLLLLAPTAGKSWQPWVLNPYPHPDSLRQLPKRQADRLNNVEQITLTNPQAGQYTIQVNGYQVAGPGQDFSIAYEFERGLSWRFPVRGDQLIPGREQRLRWHGPAPAASATGRLEYRLGEGPWQLLAQQVSLAPASFNWVPPDTISMAQVRLITDNELLTSEKFLLAPEIPLEIAYNCAEDFMLTWPAVSAASAYQVFRLGSRYLEPYQQTQDTLLVISKATNPGSYFAVAPIFQQQTGRQSMALHYERHGSVCYVESFLPRQLVSDTVVFDAQLSTNFNLASLAFQRLHQGTFRTIQTISPVAATRFVLRDLQPLPGRNEYRLLLTTQDGRHFASQSEFIFYTPATDYVLIYPNPLSAGQDLQVIISGSQETDMVLYDSIGREVARIRESGAIKTFSTQGFKPGIFFLRTQTASGKKVTRRLVIL